VPLVVAGVRKLIPPNYFDRSKPFYPLVMNYVVQLIGFKELALRGISGPRRDDLLESTLGRFSIEYGEPDEDEEALETLRSHLAKLSGPLELRSEIQDELITVDIDGIARDLFENTIYVGAWTMPAAGSIFIVAYEMAKEQGWSDREDPLWEFLRHCRNAAAHRGRFAFRGKEPTWLARWGHLEITHSLEGTPLFTDAAGNGLLSPGDPIRLLWDLEQANPQMQA
jgi:hypothetical protein